jgi:hypothetical protein
MVSVGLGGGGEVKSTNSYIFRKYIFDFLFNFYFYLPKPPHPPIIYFMIRNIYINIIKVSGMVRTRSGGLVGR